MSEGANQARRRLESPDLYMLFPQIKTRKEERKHGRKHGVDIKQAEEHREKERRRAKNEREGMVRE